MAGNQERIEQTVKQAATVTMYDKIRDMSYEEMLDLFCSIVDGYTDCCDCFLEMWCLENENDNGCTDRIREWLNSRCCNV